MDPPFATHLVLEQGVDHAVSRRLRFRLEDVRSNCDTIRKHVEVRKQSRKKKLKKKGEKEPKSKTDWK
jgi:hypothetical protein